MAHRAGRKVALALVKRLRSVLSTATEPGPPNTPVDTDGNVSCVVNGRTTSTAIRRLSCSGEASIDPVVAAGACCAGVALSYLGNRRFTFASQQTRRSDLPRFLVAYGAGFVSTLGVLATALTWMAPALAQLVNIAVTPIVIYSTMRLVGFGRPPSTAEPTCHGLDD